MRTLANNMAWKLRLLHHEDAPEHEPLLVGLDPATALFTAGLELDPETVRTGAPNAASPVVSR